MEELEFTVFNHGAEGIKRLRTLLGQFERKTNISVRLNVLPWTEGWSNMVSVVLYRDGPAISEIGSTWVGDFVRMDALQGMSDFFKLARYLPEDHNILEEAQANSIFLQGGAAVTIGGHWLLQDQNIVPEVKENLDVAPVPGVPFVGGMNLAFWEHSYKNKAALKLIEFLVNDESALDLFPEFGLPAWHDGIDNPIFSTHPSYAVLGQMLKAGRSFPTGHFWGLVENRLTDSFPFIWKDVLASPHADVDQILHNHLDPLAHRINITMQS